MPATGKYLVDTNIVIGYFNGDEPIVAFLMRAKTVFLSAIVVGELYFGAAKSGRPAANATMLDRFMADRAVLSRDREVGREYGQIKKALRVKGTPLPDNDIWIAASAIHHDLTLATRDRHFQQVEGLATEAW